MNTVCGINFRKFGGIEDQYLVFRITHGGVVSRGVARHGIGDPVKLQAKAYVSRSIHLRYAMSALSKFLQDVGTRVAILTVIPREAQMITAICIKILLYVFSVEAVSLFKRIKEFYVGDIYRRLY